MTRLMVYDGAESFPQRQDVLDATWIGNTVIGTATVITSIPTSDPDGTFTCSGTIKNTAGTAIPTSHGTIKIQKLVNSVWTDLYTGIAITTGAWSRSVTQSATTTYRAVYVPPTTTVTNRVVSGGTATLTVGTHTYTVNEWITTTGFLGTDATAGLNGTFQITAVTGTTVSFALAGTVTTGAPVSGATPQAVCGHAVSYSTSKTVSAAVLTTFTKTYACNGSASYSGGGSKRTDTDHIYQGYYDGTWDEQRSVACFPTTIQTDLAGAYSIDKVEVYLNCLHWGPGDGGTARIRTISNTTPPSTWGGVNDISTYDATAWTSKTGAKWCDITSIMGSLANWQSGGTKRGIALWASSTSGEYYGYFAGNGESGEPQLRITYRKYV